MSAQQLSIDYDDPSFDYQRYWRERKYENEAEKLALRRLLSLIPNKEKIADIAAGFGRLTSVYSPLFKNCFLIDPSARLIKKAKKLSERYPNLSFKIAPVEKLPFKPHSLDAILFVRILHHLKDPQPVIKEFQRLLKPHGFLILEFANKMHLKSGLRAILKGNFDYFITHLPEDISTDKKVSFLNYHPSHIKSLLLANGFRIVKTFSVSNFRHPVFKKLLPLKLLLFLESQFSLFTSHFHLFPGPSIFVLSQKK